MNRWDEIQATARDIASNVHADPAARDATADDGLQLGTVVYRDFEEVDRTERQGIVLGPWPGARNDRVVVWWPRFGAATPEALQYESGRYLVADGTLGNLPPQRLQHLRGKVGAHDVAAPLIRALDAALGATDRNTAPRPCCYAGTGPCALCSNTGPVGRCCFPLRDVCPLHH